jgi:hypothetical protein
LKHGTRTAISRFIVVEHQIFQPSRYPPSNIVVLGNERE